MNAFLIFCKRHRSLVREKYPHLENRSVTKILGELWANLDVSEKGQYKQLAKQYKEAFMKANPEFKWYKLPSPPNRTLVTRPSNQRNGKLELVGAESHSTSAPCGITPGKLADETQMGGLSSLILPSVSATTLTNTPSSPKQPQQQLASSKPPKKRYLENGAFRSQPSSSSSSTSEGTSTSNVNSHPSVTTSTTTSSLAATSGDPQATSDCSALLKLAEMCSIELDKPNPSSGGSGSKPVLLNGRAVGSGAVTPTTSISTPSPPPTATMTSQQQSTSGSISTTISSIIASSSSMTPSSSNTSTNPTCSSSSSTSSSSSSNSGLTLSRFGKMIASAVSGGKVPPSANSSLLPFQLMSDRYSAGQGLEAGTANATSATAANVSAAATAADKPLDLCKEKTITASHQELINCIVDGAFNNLPKQEERGSSSSSSSSTSASSVTSTQSFHRSKMAKAKQPIYNGPASSEGLGEDASTDKAEGGKGAARKKAKNTHSGAGGEAASQHESLGMMGVDDGSYAGDDDKSDSPRKSQRSCKGKRYQALMNEGVLHPAKDRKFNNNNNSSNSLANSRRPGAAGEGYDEYPDAAAFSMQHRTRTPSDSSESATSRKSDRDDGLKYSKLYSKSGASTDDELEGGHSGFERLSPKQRHSSVESAGSSRSRKRFKTGDFDLEAHIAALPKCNFEVLDRRKQKRPGSANSSGSGRKGSTSGGSASNKEDSYRHPHDDIDCLSDDGSDKADSSSSESRGEKPVLVGSQKRKARKRSITHLDPASGCTKSKSGILGSMKLVALAEAAMCEERMPSSYNQNDGDSQTESA